MSEKDDDTTTDLDESLDLSDIENFDDDIDDVIGDLDKSLSNIDKSMIEEGKSETVSAGEDETTEIPSDLLKMVETGPSLEEPLGEKEVTGDIPLSDDQIKEEIDALSEIDDFDPLVDDIENDVDSFELPNFKEAKDISVALEIFDEMELSRLKESQGKLSTDLFNDNSEYVRAKRKISSLIKKKEKEEEEKEAAEINRIQKENEEANNILPIDKLIKTATDIDTSNMDSGSKKQGRFINIKESINKIKSNIVKERVVEEGKEKLEKALEYKKERLSTLKSDLSIILVETKKLLIVHLNKALRTKTFAVGALILFEIAKTTIPAVIVAIFIIGLNQKSVTPEIIGSIVSKDPIRIQLGLEMIKENLDEDQKKRYYSLVEKQLKREIDQSWDPANSNGLITRTNFILSLDSLDFNDKNFNIKDKVDYMMTKNKKRSQATYQVLYDSEKKLHQKQEEFLGHLMEANIFLKNKKCLNAIEHYVKAEIKIPNSKAVKYGKVLGINCLHNTDFKANVTSRVFEIQQLQDALDFIEVNQNRLPASNR